MGLAFSRFRFGPLAQNCKNIISPSHILITHFLKANAFLETDLNKQDLLQDWKKKMINVKIAMSHYFI